MINRTAWRRQLYREGKRLLGPERMARLRTRSFGLGRRLARQGARGRDALRGRGRRHWLSGVEIEWVDGSGVLLTGRLMSTGGALEAASLTLGGGTPLRIEMATGTGAGAALVRFETREDRRRRDGIARGFAVLVDVPAREVRGLRDAGAAQAESGYRLRLTTGSGTVTATGRLPDPAALGYDALGRVRAILERVPPHRDGRRALFDRAFGPAIERLWNEHRAGTAPVDGECVRYGDHPPGQRHATSVIVPVYGRCDFIEHQMAHFAFDPDLAGVDLLYVVDDPRLHVRTRALVERLSRSVDLPFSVLYLTRNSGFAAANNAGARHARGADLLLLNSDVLPGERGWLSAMYASVDGRLTGTLLGARMLYEDGTLQHDGMRFEPADSHEGQWLNRHPGKGLPADLFPSRREAQPRQAVTGACLLLTRRDWDALGGLDEAYLLGDFEDSDLCLRARAAGLDIRLCTDVSLFHLERQSQSLVAGARWKDLLTYYNCWYQSRRWNEQLASLTGPPAHG